MSIDYLVPELLLAAKWMNAVLAILFLAMLGIHVAHWFFTRPVFTRDWWFEDISNV